MNNDTDAMQLKPCPNPWCEAEERDGDFSPVIGRTTFGNWQVSCTSCPQKGPVATNEPAAIAAWNYRTTSLAAQDGLVEKAGGMWYRRWFKAQNEAIKIASLLRTVTDEYLLDALDANEHSDGRDLLNEIEAYLAATGYEQ